jgi:hypothetical protein
VPSLVKPVAPAALAAMPTRQLLALRDKLLACEESLAASDAEPHEVDPATIRFKDDPRWAPLHAAVKAELGTREHVPRRRGPRARR